MFERTVFILTFALLLVISALAQDSNEAFLAAARTSEVATVKVFLDKDAEANHKTQYRALSYSEFICPQPQHPV
ncbi:MAG: hypothetical protein HY231_08460 [Acidobacteria bacterium]|nr:hypothetical protein [Acidobacteriota bacterium]